MKKVCGTIYLNPSHPSTDITLSFAQIVEDFTTDFTIWIGGDFNAINAIDPIDATFKVRAGDRRLKRHQQVSVSFNSMACFDVFKQNKRLKTHCEKNNEESRIDYIFSNECDLVESVKTIKTPLSDHYILQLNTFTKNQDPCYRQKRWKLGYNIINDPKNLLETSALIKKVVQSLNEEELTNNYDIFKAKLMDWLRYLDLRDQKRRRDLLKQSIESDNTRTAQIERLKASFHSI